MKKLNNKGFAITGILYTLLVMFLLVLVFSLQILRANKNMREKSIEKLESTYEGIELNSTEIASAITTDETTVYKGKYIFSLTVQDELGKKKEYKCISYLTKGTKLLTNDGKIAKEKIKFIPDDCNKYELTYVKNNSITQQNANEIKLIKVYKFEGD